MQKTLAVLITAAAVALPSIASARPHHRHHHHRHHHAVTAPMDEGNAGPHFIAEAFHQIFVPLEVTFGGRHYD